MSQNMDNEEPCCSKTCTEEDTDNPPKPTYEQNLDEKRFTAFKDLMKRSEIYADFLRQKMRTHVAARTYEFSRKQSLMKYMATEYKKKRIHYEKYVVEKQPSIMKSEDPFNILDGEMLNSAGEVVSMMQPFSLENVTMRTYQIDGLNWLKSLYEYGISGILADEMGLGKTIQSIAVIAHLYEMGVTGHYLIVAPLSTLYNWVAEFEKFAPKVPILLYHGMKNVRLNLRKKLRTTKFLDSEVFPVMITSYEMAIKDHRYLGKINWRYLVVDEGHRLKNFQSRLVTTLKQFDTNCRLLLTGTPLQNNLAELWSLMNFLIPEVFQDMTNFQSWFDADGLMVSESCSRIIKMEREQQILSTMHRILRPFVLRRKKDDVEINIPPKKEVIVYAPMTEIQKKYYSATLDKTISEYFGIKELFQMEEEEGGSFEEELEPPIKKPKLEGCENTKKSGLRSSSVPKGRTRFKVPTGRTSLKTSNSTMHLRKIVNHPYLIHFPYHPGTEEIKIDEDLVQSCGKLLVLDAMLSKLKQMGHKVLIFSQMTMLMDILEEYLEMRHYGYVRFDGKSSLEERQAAIATFNKKETFIFLLSTRAGGLGINLTTADTVILYESDWNPQCDFQAIDRCHRIGQTLPVIVYRLVTSGTIDEKMVELGQAKAKLEALVIDKGKFKQRDENFRELSIHELQELLNSKDNQCKIQPNGLVFTDEELKSLLDRNLILGDANDLKRTVGRSTLRIKETTNKSASNQESTDVQVKAEEMPQNRVFKIL
ncbi:lymphoid-specific helicase-like [Hetaerina americana]|uniref:lymphoid-specific helicase-like n=1 Tax=Hetaerina americana TaxID=62018 RepID=UPI003A7F4306